VAAGIIVVVIKLKGHPHLQSLILWSASGSQNLDVSLDPTTDGPGGSSIGQRFAGTVVTGVDVVLAMVVNLAMLMAHGLFRVIFQPSKYAFINGRLRRGAAARTARVASPR
jgi:hypothetical protein